MSIPRLPIALCLLAITSVALANGDQPVSFELDVQPILTARGCNQGPATAKPAGRTASSFRSWRLIRTSTTPH
jgi:hypothetical protein